MARAKVHTESNQPLALFLGWIYAHVWYVHMCLVRAYMCVAGRVRVYVAVVHVYVAGVDVCAAGVYIFRGVVQD